ncbi:hypothetical protein BUALT_Bualt02G0056100 [Buddleja alternifolia]|uniref:Nudix hydrolase domain-containing protein n=1 Tax=Buddleja alternifolia TaxID=168488 RepID=A0AAV6Y8D4_9LAMI|nr:hypothetical protein BUALT_Bualt02G0056100 [Buddleja alternifolia]
METTDLPAFNLLLSCPSALSPSQVSVVFDQAYDRIPHPDITLENTISEIWDGRVQQNPSLYNGLKFRYGGHTLSGGTDPSQKTDVCLHLGLTDYRFFSLSLSFFPPPLICYKTFVGTNLNPLWERFLFPSEETSDKEIVVLQRSTNVGEFPGHFVFPGGHAEPQEVDITSHNTYGEITNQMVNRKVSEEMFDSIIREVVEEIGVPATSLEKPVFIGISQRVLNVRPTAFFFIKCSLQSKEIQELYHSAQDGYESIQLYTMPVNNLGVIASKMPGCHQGGFALYKLMLDAAKENK